MVSFPNLPDLPGVPAIGRLIGAHLPLPVSMIADALGLSSFLAPRWGIFDLGGNAVLVGDAVHSLDFQVEYRVADFPIERGGFSSYNKVQQPFAVKVSFMIGGLESDRTQFIGQVDAAVASLALFNVVTPEVTYVGVNLTHYDYSRSVERGAALMRIDVWCEEIRVATSATFNKTQLPAGADPINEGQQQSAPPSEAQATAAPTDPLSKGGDPSQSVAPASSSSAIDVSGATSGAGPGVGPGNSNTGTEVIDIYTPSGLKTGLMDKGFVSNLGPPRYDVNGIQVTGAGFVAK